VENIGPAETGYLHLDHDGGAYLTVRAASNGEAEILLDRSFPPGIASG
jgi:hypothetical protein